jgi:PAS domain S-box-containing protein
MNKKSRSPSGGSEPQENEPNTDSTTSVDADFLERFKHPMMVVDQYGEIVQFNSTFLDIDENAREELIGKYETDVIRPYDGEIDLGKTADDNDGNSTVWRAVVEGHIKTSNGMVFPVTITPRELADTSLTCLSIDCLIEKEAAKPDSERSGIASVGTDGELHVENEFFTDFFTPKPGHVHETVSDISDFVDIDGQGTFESIVMTAMDTGDHTTVTVKNPDTGQYIECSISPSEVGATIKATDMTERESKIEQLQNSTQQYRGIFNNPYVYGLIVSMEDAQVIDVNQTVLDYFGNTAEDIVGKAFTETTIWQQKTSATVDFAEVLTKIDNGEEATLKMQFDYRGEEEWFQVCCTPIYDNNSEVIGFAAVGVDSTAYENTKSKLQATEREFNALFNNPHAFTALLDTTGRIVEVNENGANVAEETREELNGMKVGDTSFTGKQQTTSQPKTVQRDIQQQSFTVRDPVEGRDNELTVSITPTDDKLELPELESRQRRAIDAIDKREDDGALVRIRAHTPDNPDAKALTGFQRGMAASTNCDSYGKNRTAPTTREYEWTVYNVSNSELTEFVKWASFYLFGGWWATENGYDTDQILPDGSFVMENGSVVDSPYQLDSVTLESIPADFYDNF